MPGTEDSETKEEAWKIRARTAAQTAGTAARERARSLWKAAAKELAASHQQQQRTPHAGAQRFADIVTLVAAARAKGQRELLPAADVAAVAARLHYASLRLSLCCIGSSPRSIVSCLIR